MFQKNFDEGIRILSVFCLSFLLPHNSAFLGWLDCCYCCCFALFILFYSFSLYFVCLFFILFLLSFWGMLYSMFLFVVFYFYLIHAHIYVLPLTLKFNKIRILCKLFFIGGKLNCDLFRRTIHYTLSTLSPKTGKLSRDIGISSFYYFTVLHVIQVSFK